MVNSLFIEHVGVTRKWISEGYSENKCKSPIVSTLDQNVQGEYR